jgi:hypothetical protein
MFFSPSEQTKFGLTVSSEVSLRIRANTIVSARWCPRRKAYSRYSTKRWDMVSVSANGSRHKILSTTAFRFRVLLQWGLERTAGFAILGFRLLRSQQVSDSAHGFQ